MKMWKRRNGAGTFKFFIMIEGLKWATWKGEHFYTSSDVFWYYSTILSISRKSPWSNASDNESEREESKVSHMELVHSSTLFPSAQLSCRSKLSFSAQKTFPSAQLVPYPPSTAVLKGRMTSEGRGSAKAWKKKISRSLIFLTENNDGPTCHNARKKNHPGTLTHAIACHTQKHTHI